MATQDHPRLARSGSDSLMLECPRCRLRLTQRHASLTVELCPRCIAHAHRPVRMLPVPPDIEAA
jgi:hypothetical protein